MSKEYPVLGAQGNTIPNAYLVDSPQRQHLQQLQTEFIDTYAHNCTNSRGRGRRYYDVGLDGTMCNDPLPPISPTFIAEFSRLEREQAKEMGHVACKKLSSFDTPLPLIYLPDSALHTAHGIIDSLTANDIDHAVFAVDRNDTMPKEAIALAHAAGHLFLCDSVINLGMAASSILKKIPKAPTQPLTITTLFNHASADTQEKELHNAQRPARGLPSLQESVRQGRHNLRFYTGDIAHETTDIFDRASAIRYAAHHQSHDSALQTYLNGFLKQPSF